MTSEPTDNTRATSDRPSPHGRWGLAAVLAGGAVLRVLLLCWFQGEPLYIDDERSYNQLATSLAVERRYADPSGELTSLRPPLYPAVVAATYAICGVENFQAVRILQSVLGLVLVVLVYLLAKGLFCPRVGVGAAGICAFYPSLAVYNNLLLSETLFALLLTLACLTLLGFFQRKSIGLLIVFGVVLGLAALTRSVVWLFPPFLALFLFFATTDAGWRRRLLVAIAPVAAFALTVAPWSLRNAQVEHAFVGIDSMGGRNFMMGNYAHTPLYRTWDAISIQGEKAWWSLLAKEYPNYHQFTQGQRDKLALRHGLRFVLQNPALTAKRDLVKFFNFWQLERELVAGAAIGFWGHVPRPAILALALAVIGSYALTLLSAVFGFALMPASDRRLSWFVLLLVAFVCAVHTAVFGHSRYHLPLMPLVFVWSSAALFDLPGIWRKRATWAFGIAAAVCLVLVASWAWEVVALSLPQWRNSLTP